MCYYLPPDFFSPPGSGGGKGVEGMINFFPGFCSMSCLFFLFLARAGWTGLDWVWSAASRFCCN